MKTIRRSVPSRVVATCLMSVVLLAAALSQKVCAATLDSWLYGLNANNSEDFFNDYSADKNWQRKSSLAPIGPILSTSSQFRYAHLLALDVRAGNSNLEQSTSSYFVSFDVVAGPAEDWWISITTEWKGRLFVNDDGCGKARALVEGAVQATYAIDGGVPVEMSELRFPKPSDANNENNEGSDASTTVSNPTSGMPRTYCLRGTGPQSIKLDFSWVNTVASNPTGALCGQGDEAAVLFGEPGALPDTEADNYPTNGAQASSHGHFVTVALSEPPTATVTAEGVCTSTSGTPCVLTLAGIAEGCLGKNYHIVVTWYNTAGQVGQPVTATITNGQNWWTTTLAVAGACGNFPYTYVVEAYDDPGIIGGDIGSEQFVSARPVAVLARGRLDDASLEACDGSAASLPGLGDWGGTLVLLLLAATGAMALARRARAA